MNFICKSTDNPPNMEADTTANSPVSATHSDVLLQYIVTSIEAQTASIRRLTSRIDLVERSVNKLLNTQCDCIKRNTCSLDFIRDKAQAAIKASQPIPTFIMKKIQQNDLWSEIKEFVFEHIKSSQVYMSDQIIDILSSQQWWDEAKSHVLGMKELRKDTDIPARMRKIIESKHWVNSITEILSKTLKDVFLSAETRIPDTINWCLKVLPNFSDCKPRSIYRLCKKYPALAHNFRRPVFGIGQGDIVSSSNITGQMNVGVENIRQNGFQTYWAGSIQSALISCTHQYPPQATCGDTWVIIKLSSPVVALSVEIGNYMSDWVCIEVKCIGGINGQSGWTKIQQQEGGLDQYGWRRISDTITVTTAGTTTQNEIITHIRVSLATTQVVRDFMTQNKHGLHCT